MLDLLDAVKMEVVRSLLKILNLVTVMHFAIDLWTVVMILAF